MNEPQDTDDLSTAAQAVNVTVNGTRALHQVLPRTHLIDFLREDLGLKGSHLGCEHGVCGACTVRLDGQIVRGCLVLAVQTDGRRVDTIEGMSDSGAIRDLQQAFVRHNALQCGFCTSGMLMAASELLDTKPLASREEVREWMSGNYCRCTGYQAIVDAICEVLAARETTRHAGASA
jgi:aerobic-type carbon monoxide dehydrogenase small subunit (CoxS/CutS family)